MRLAGILISLLAICAFAIAEEDAVIIAEDGNAAEATKQEEEVLIAEESNVNSQHVLPEHGGDGGPENKEGSYPPVVGYGGYPDPHPVPLRLPIRPDHPILPHRQGDDGGNNYRPHPPPPPHLKPVFHGNGGRPPHDGPRPGYGGEGPRPGYGGDGPRPGHGGPPHGRPNGDRPVYHGGDRPEGRPQGHGNNHGGGGYGGDDPWPLPQPEMPKIVNLDVKCEKNLMKVSVEFDKPFYGIIFSKGHYSNGQCIHLPSGTGRKWANFDISINSCGTTGNTQNGLYGYGADSGSGTYFENTIVIQYDSQVQEVWDQARKLRCTWHDQYEKSVTFRPFPVDMMAVFRADFAGDNVGCWMQIQVGKGPWASEVSGLVKIGQTMTMVLAIKDDDNKFDMLVRNCIAHDGKRAPIQLVDNNGCIVRPKLMSRFTKIKNFGSSATVLSYAHFQAFKFPDSMDVHFQCTIQICRYQCPEQCAGPVDYQGKEAHGDEGYESAPPSNYVPAGRPRDERDVSAQQTDVIDMTEIGINRIIQVVSPGDLAFALSSANDTAPRISTHNTEYTNSGFICMSTPSFAASLAVLLAILITSCLLSTYLFLKYRNAADKSEQAYNLPPFKKSVKH